MEMYVPVQAVVPTLRVIEVQFPEVQVSEISRAQGVAARAGRARRETNNAMAIRDKKVPPGCRNAEVCSAQNAEVSETWQILSAGT